MFQKYYLFPIKCFINYINILEGYIITLQQYTVRNLSKYSR